MQPKDRTDHNRMPRIPRLADGSNAHSWYAHSRSRVATGLLLTMPGIPMLFMGQEFLEDKQWSDDVHGHPELRLFWAGLDSATDSSMRDFLRFTRELIALRWRQPGAAERRLRADSRPRREPRAGVSALGARRRRRRRRRRESGERDEARLRDRISRRRSLAGGIQQRRLRAMGQSERRWQWWRRGCGWPTQARAGSIRGVDAARERDSRLRSSVRYRTSARSKRPWVARHCCGGEQQGGDRQGRPEDRGAGGLLLEPSSVAASSHSAAADPTVRTRDHITVSRRAD